MQFVPTKACNCLNGNRSWGIWQITFDESIVAKGALKGYQQHPARGPGRLGPRDASEFSCFKTRQSIRKWMHFSKILHFYCQKSSFLRQISKIEHISQYLLCFFERLFKLWIFLEGPDKSKEIPYEFYCSKIYYKKLNMALIEKDYRNWDDSWNFRLNSPEICIKMIAHQDMMNAFHRAEKIKKSACKTLRVWPKNEQETLKSFKKNFGCFDQISMIN